MCQKFLVLYGDDGKMWVLNVDEFVPLVTVALVIVVFYLETIEFDSFCSLYCC
ncbi:hypothetical protein QJS10_CPA07g01365 [Acorus calamus]|uniref:Transmembrane protein n=1 Tax=Acorus calamus TaxID=4465 RepID=A0AAV9EHA9_ACOCL|nr:hypothetical protein QJS10_CPA07g01365 [Acorus calamus]